MTLNDPLSRDLSVDLSAFADAGWSRIDPVVTSVAPMQRKRQPGTAVSLQKRKLAGPVLGHGGVKLRPSQARKASALVLANKQIAERKPVVSHPKDSTSSREVKARDNCKLRPKRRRGGGAKKREFVPWCR